MTRSLLLLYLLLSFSLTNAQITIDDTDFPSAGDTVIYSTVSPLTPGIDLTLTGPNYLWDFSNLLSNGQRADTFITVGSTGTIYGLYFTFVVNANMASRGSLPSVPGIGIGDVYNFYKKNTSGFLQVGVGASLNGQEVPIGYSAKDTVYKFPLDFGDHDSSFSVFGISLPGLGSYNGEQNRINDVDGWGSIITPFDTLNCLRIVTELTGRDSLYADTLGFGFGFDRTLTREYKWIAKGFNGPILQINTQELLPGSESITAIYYRDVLQVTSVFDETNAVDFAIYPNPASDRFQVSYNSSKAGIHRLSLVNMEGQLLSNSSFNSGSGKNVLDFNSSGIPNGIYLLRIEIGSEIINKKLIIAH
jgi:Secretion system C-terminal sorting domain